MLRRGRGKNRFDICESCIHPGGSCHNWCVLLLFLTAFAQKFRAGDDRVTQAITEVEEVMYQCSPFLRFFEGEDCEDDCTKDLTRAGSKLRRALDKLRRAALKVVDRPVPSTRGQEGASSPINTLLLKIVAMYADAANEVRHYSCSLHASMTNDC